LILVVRNIVQFGRLLSIMRRSGTSIFAGPKPIDLSRPRPTAMDIDMDDDDVYDESNYSRLGTNDVLFDARGDTMPSPTPPPPPAHPPRPPPPEEDEDMWANVS